MREEKSAWFVSLRLAAAACCALLMGLADAGAQGRPIEAHRASTFGNDDLMLPIFAPGSESDADLGVQMILDPEADYDPLTLAGYAGYEFTDNANLSEFAPQVKVRGTLEGSASVISIEKARRLIGYSPKFSWKKLRASENS